ncbi:hypothetical protein CH063_03777 [Colletotrichum higginsianum]|uniref:Uncharacterized protein n=1 Tax=Colletotrichum higginsianum (strain IMI 349063) TaxID=759273 RepID=H1W0R4_COLHI|nr:hypothetical protein CH063_03777 [Colletotrichum higginsianum]
MLYNALAFALLRDALANEGPGRLERVDRKKVCADPAAGKLDALEIQATEAVLADAARNVLVYPNKVNREPAIKDYARQYQDDCLATERFDAELFRGQYKDVLYRTYAAWIIKSI